MLKRKFIFAVSVLAILAVGNAYADDPADTPSTTDTVGTEHTVYGSTTLSGAQNYATSGIAGVTYVNRMVNVAGNAAQAAESHAAAAGASALSAASAAAAAQTAANNAQTTANGIADKEDKSNKVTSLSSTSTNTQYPGAKLVYDELAKKQDKLTIDSALSSTSTNPVQNKVVNSALSGKEATSNKVTSLSSTSTNTQYPGAKLVYDELAKKQNTLTAGANITIASDGKTISATDTTYSAGTNISLSGTTFNVPTANGTNLGVVKQGSNITIASDGTISATDTVYTLPAATSSALGGVKAGGANITIAADGTISAKDTTYSTGSASTAGLTKLYTDVGTNTDGTMTQNAIKSAISSSVESKLNKNLGDTNSDKALITDDEGNIVASTISSGMIRDATIVDADISSTANIAQAKIANLVNDLDAKVPKDWGTDHKNGALITNSEGKVTVGKITDDMINEGVIGKSSLVIKNGATGNNMVTFSANATTAQTVTIPAATASVAGLAKYGQIPSGGATSTTYASIWVE